LSGVRSIELTLRIMLCGFFNKFNDALAIEEEPEAIERLATLTDCVGSSDAGPAA
jgi:hypothetical protein